MTHHDRLKSVTDLVEMAGKMPDTTVLIPGGDRVEDVRFVDSARDRGIIKRAILVGNQDKIRKHAAHVGVVIDPHDIIHIEDELKIGIKTVEMVNAGQVDIVLKGGISTPVINRAMLKLAVKPTVSLVSIFNAPQISDGRPMILTDAGVTTDCNFNRMVDIINNAVEVAQKVMRIATPKVAVLSANEKLIPSLPSTSMGLELSKLKWDNAVVCGPLSFDLATDPDSVAIKGMPDCPNSEAVAGQADILVCPGLDSANILYKTITSLTKYGDASIAGITIGFKVPYIILSRSDSLATRLESVALCSVYAHRCHDTCDKTETLTHPAGLTMPAQTEIRYRVLKVVTEDCAGALTGVSAVFSNDNFSIKTITGQGAHPDKKGVIEIGFESDEQTKDILIRKIKRLTKVISIQEVKTEYHETNNLRSIV